uniref:RNase III domain-containing protein n=1 Tax=Trichobilharzia regenti TaxID=157069 RepID=A0AA85K1P4_TRIRE|nr:unnamed protein product [Trichobilharzia regenti]
MWIPPVCDNPPPLKIEDELLPSTLGTKTPTVSASSSSSSDNQENSQYQRARCLSSPYQVLPSCGTTVYLYTWTVPAPDVVADLCCVAKTCFAKADGAIGLLFSKPISKKEYVCRIPLYLTRGMARSRVRLVGKLTLSQRELDSIKSAHSVICELITNIAHLSHVGHKPSSQALCDLMEKEKHSNEIPESVRVTVTDRFTDMLFSPEKANILALMTLIQLPACTIDHKAIESLLNWSICRTNSFSSDIEDSINGSVKIKPVRGILPSWHVRLNQIPAEDWVGLVVRPIHLPDSDPSMFLISEVCSETPVSCVPQYLASKVCNTENVEEVSVMTYFDFYKMKCPLMRGLAIDISMPLCKASRLTRHQSCTQVTAGLRRSESLPRQSVFVCEGCLVHPLSSWLWFLVSTIPAVLYQMTRALLASELFTDLAAELKNPQPCCQRTHLSSMTDDSLSPVTIFVPDRLRDADFPNGKAINATKLDFKVDKLTSEEDREMDDVAASEYKGVATVCPQPSDLIEPTTLLSARDAVNLERLEFYGDSFLHLISTLSVYGTSPQDADEGYLTWKRTSLISNAHLCDIARGLAWYRYCTGQIFSPSKHFVPPCYTVSSEVSDCDTRLYTRLCDKSLADMVEALLACFLVHIGLPSSVNLLHYLQICPVNWDTIKCDEKYRIDAPWHCLLHSESDIASSSNSRRHLLRVSSQNSLTTCKYQDLNEKYFDLQLKLDYRFRNIELLATAMTHQSSTNTEYWGNYQRLEFLGDSVMGFIVSNHLFRKCPHASPGKLSEMRSTIVSNNNLADTVVEHQLYEFIDSGVCDIKPCIDEIQSIHHQTDSICERIELLMKKVVEGLNVKILADVFESILGAIFVDSNGNHAVLSSIILRFLGRSINYWIDKLLKNPNQQLHSSQYMKVAECEVSENINLSN